MPADAMGRATRYRTACLGSSRRFVWTPLDGGLQRLRPSGSACDGSYRRGWRFYTLPVTAVLSEWAPLLGSGRIRRGGRVSPVGQAFSPPTSAY